MTITFEKIVSVATLATALTGCVVGDPTTSSTAGVSFEEFKAQTYRETFAGGSYIVNGDTPILDEKALYEFWQSLQQGNLIVDNNGGTDSKWNDTEKLNLTYCVSNSFGTANKAKIVEALRQATDLGWEVRANVNFTYVSAQDGNCTAGNNNVVFNVNQVSGQPYLARAFFPNQPRSSREVLVDVSSFDPTLTWPLAHILSHELGHTLGFRHEHTRPEAATCFEDNNWRPLTTYDSASVMHYPQCNGSSADLAFTAKDAAGSALLYGAPNGGGNPPPPPPPPPPGNIDHQTGTVATGAKQNFGPYSVKAGSLFTVTITGTGDPDLYVRFGAAPTTTRFSCRPFLNGASERCSLNVPAGQSTAFVMIRGFAAATFTMDAAWTAP
jgi:serine protease